MGDTAVIEEASSDRRAFLKRAAAAGVAAWTAPVILDSLASPASALTCLGNCYQVEWQASANGTACPVVTGTNKGEAWGSNKPKTECLPYCPNGSGGPTSTSGTTFTNLGLTYDTANSLDGVTVTNGVVSGGSTPTGNSCSVPNQADSGTVHRVRVFTWNPTTFGATFAACKSPQVNAIMAGVAIAEVPVGQTLVTANCVGDGGGSGTAYGVSKAEIRPNTPAAGQYQFYFLLDGGWKAMAGQSGAYRFTVGCQCQ